MSEQDGTYSKRPDYIAYNVQPSRDGKGHWNRVGAAWTHKDGKGYEVDLESLPLSGRVTLREMRDERMQGYQEQQTQAAQPEHDRVHDDDRQRSR